MTVGIRAMPSAGSDRWSESGIRAKQGNSAAMSPGRRWACPRALRTAQSLVTLGQARVRIEAGRRNGQSGGARAEIFWDTMPS